MRRHRRGGGDGLLFAAFGIGLLCCTVCPSKLVVLLLAVALVACGFSCAR